MRLGERGEEEGGREGQTEGRRKEGRREGRKGDSNTEKPSHQFCQKKMGVEQKCQVLEQERQDGLHCPRRVVATDGEPRRKWAGKLDSGRVKKFSSEEYLKINKVS